MIKKTVFYISLALLVSATLFIVSFFLLNSREVEADYYIYTPDSTIETVSLPDTVIYPQYEIIIEPEIFVPFDGLVPEIYEEDPPLPIVIADIVESPETDLTIFQAETLQDDLPIDSPIIELEPQILSTPMHNITSEPSLVLEQDVKISPIPEIPAREPVVQVVVVEAPEPQFPIIKTDLVESGNEFLFEKFQEVFIYIEPYIDTYVLETPQLAFPESSLSPNDYLSAIWNKIPQSIDRSLIVKEEVIIEMPPHIELINPLDEGFYRSEVSVSFKVFREIESSEPIEEGSVYWIDPEGTESLLLPDENNLFQFSYQSKDHDGPLFIKIGALKDNGLRDEKIISWKEDIKGPYIAILSPGERGSVAEEFILKGTVVTEDREYADIGEIDSLSVTLGSDESSVPLTFNEDGTFEVMLNSPEGDGVFFVNITALDKNSHQSELSLPLYREITQVVQSSEPPFIEIRSPENNSLYYSSIEIEGTVYDSAEKDSLESVKELYWSFAGENNQNVIDFNRRGRFSIELSTVDMNRPLNIVITAVHENDRTFDSFLTLINDQKGPEIQLETPVNGQYYGSSIFVKGKVEDLVRRKNEVKSLYWAFTDEIDDQNLIFFNDDGTFDFTIDSEEINGLKNLQFFAYDLNNNQTTSTIELKDGKKPPVIVLEEPSGESQYGAGLYIKGKVVDPYSWLPDFGGIESLYLNLEPAAILSKGDSTRSELALEEDGSFEIHIKMNDRIGSQKVLLEAVASNGNKSEEEFLTLQGSSLFPDFSVTQQDGQLMLDWTTYPFISSYSIQFTDDGSDPNNGSTKLNSVYPPYVVDDLVNGKLYSFVLKGISDDDIIESEVIKSIPLSPYTLEPYAKSEFGYVEVSWLPVEGADLYRILRADEGGEYRDISGPVSGNRFLDEEAVFGKSYHYKIVLHEYEAIDSEIVSGQLLTEPPERLSEKGSLKSIVPEAVAVEGDYAFVVSKDDGFYIIDISDDDKPEVRGYVQMSGLVALDVWDDYAVLAAGESGFTILNISDLSEPRVVGSRKTLDCRAVQIKDGYIYVADGERGIKVFDMERITRPARVFYDDSFEALDIHIFNSTLLVSSGEGGMNVFDISNPEEPGFISHYDQSPVFSVITKGNFAYTASGEEGAYILDLSDVRRPYIASRFQTVNARDVSISGNHLLVADGEGGLVDLDITDPYRPESFETMILSNSTSVDVNEKMILVADKSGLYTVRSYQYGRSFKIGSFSTPGDANSISIEDRFVYVADHSKGFHILSDIDNSDFSKITITNTYGTEYAEKIYVYENTVLVADGPGGIKAFSRSGGELIIGSEIEISGNVRSLSVEEDIILAAAGNGGVYSLIPEKKDEEDEDVEADGNLEAIDDRKIFFNTNQLIILSDVRDVLSYGSYVYAIDRQRGLVITRFGSNSQLSIVSEIPLAGAFAAVRFENDLYVAHADGVSIFDLEEKQNPDLVEEIESRYVEDLQIVGKTLYIAEGHAGLSIYSISDEHKATKISVCEDVFADSVTVDGDYAYVADSTGINLIKIHIPQWIKSKLD